MHRSRSMKVSVKESSVVKPMEETPSGSMWLSCLDWVLPATYHTRSVYFFRYDGSANFFEAAVLKEALRRTLVAFYPLAGRLRKDEKGRIEIKCCCEGVVFVEAECNAALDDLASFTAGADLDLVPQVDYSHGISSFPLSLLQLTRFKCGGVSLGVASEHHAADGIAGLHYINTWSQVARGLTPAGPPLMERRLLAARDPPRPHVEHQPPPHLRTPLQIPEATSFRTLALTRDHLSALKHKCSRYSTYEAIAGHVWRCICISPDQETKLQLPVDGRPRLRPPLLREHAIFYTTSTALCGDLASKPLGFAVARMDDDYLRSAVDYLELELPKSDRMVRSGNNVRCPNFGITSWLRLPFYEADFGWGKPAYAGPAGPLFADPQNQGGVFIAITLLKPHMDLFQNLLYHI